MFNILLSISPVIIYLVALYMMDKFMLARWKMLAGFLVWGVVSMLMVYGITNICEVGQWPSEWIEPVIEEVLKCLPLIILIFRRKIAFYAETLIYGQVVGGGFALGENILYVLKTDMTGGTALLRGFDTALMHMGCTALLASLVLMPVLYASQNKCSGKVLFGLCVSCLLMFIPSVVIHHVHNMTLQSDSQSAPYILLMIIVVGFFILFTIIEAINELLIIKWMDVSINEDIKLLNSLKSGDLMNTKAGKYLEAIREKFDKLVFFDMCVYVGLYLELLISAKSRMMLREAGLETPPTAKEKEDLKSKREELNAISKRIPRSAHRLLAPLLHASNQNKWAIDHL